jgi:hypothetical protein
MDTTVYVLTTLFEVKGELRSKNVRVTTNIHDAEAHVAEDAANGYDTLSMDSDWREGAAISETVMIMREMGDQIRADVEKSLR